MAFDSTIFLFLFLPIILSIWLLSHKQLGNYFLVFTSLLFYAWGQSFYVLVLIASILANHFTGRYLERQEAGHRKAVLSLGLVANLLLLTSFNYVEFLAENLNHVLILLGTVPIGIPEIKHPVGVSFFTFQAITYIVDIYRGQAPAQKRIIDTALFISFFPRLLAGPIGTYRKLYSQLESRTMSYPKFALGVRRFVIGLAKKVLIANTLAGPANGVFNLLPSPISAELAWLGAVCYTLQIYFDFSGYSDMAIGLGHMFGFDVPENFNFPYTSTSIREFWRRWHITLSNWFRDYLYIPLGGNQVANWKIYRNLLLVFFLCGLWHGPAWTFVIWGLYHGLFLVLERLGLEKFLGKLWQPISHLYVLLVVTIGWVVFRASDLDTATTMLKSMFFLGSAPSSAQTLSEFLNRETFTAILLATIFSTPIFNHIHQKYLSNDTDLDWKPISATAWCGGLLVLLALSFMQLVGSTHNPFIYFQF